jgi:hypothetical protein
MNKIKLQRPKGIASSKEKNSQTIKSQQSKPAIIP